MFKVGDKVRYVGKMHPLMGFRVRTTMTISKVIGPPTQCYYECDHNKGPFHSSELRFANGVVRMVELMRGSRTTALSSATPEEAVK